jgi:hypothetical protein
MENGSHATQSVSTSKEGPRPRWANSKALIAVEFALFALIFLADIYNWHHVIRFSKTLYLLPLGWISLRVRGLGWKDVGFRIFRSWRRTLAVGVLWGVGMEALELFATQPLLVRITHKWPDLSVFHQLQWNYKLLPILLALTWTVGAFGEEFVYRGYLMNRMADLFGKTRMGWTLSLLVTSAVFGCAHLYQGVTGVVENVIAGLLLGYVYLRSDHSLATPIIAHGMQDTVDFLLIFVGKYPGM